MAFSGPAYWKRQKLQRASCLGLLGCTLLLYLWAASYHLRQFTFISNPFFHLYNASRHNSEPQPFSLHLYNCATKDCIRAPWDWEWFTVTHRRGFIWSSSHNNQELHAKEPFLRFKTELVEEEIEEATVDPSTDEEWFEQRVQHPFMLEINDAVVLPTGVVHQRSGNFLWDLEPRPCQAVKIHPKPGQPVASSGLSTWVWDQWLVHNGGCRWEDRSVYVTVQWWGREYFHWMIEDLPRLAPFLDHVIEHQIAVVVPWRSHRQHSDPLVFLLGLVGIRPNNIIALKQPEGECLVAKKVFLPSTSACGSPNTIAIQLWRTRLISAIHNKLIPTTCHSTAMKDVDSYNEECDPGYRPIVVIKRDAGASRSVKNHVELVSELRRRLPSETIVEFDGKQPMNHQVLTFYHAKLVVGPHGAGLSNMIFAQDDVKIVEVWGEDNVNKCFANLASKLGLEYHSLIAPTEGEMIVFDISRTVAIVEEALGIKSLPFLLTLPGKSIS